MRPRGRRRTIVKQRDSAAERLVFALLLAGIVCLAAVGILTAADIAYVF